MRTAITLGVVVLLWVSSAMAQPLRQTPTILKSPADWRFEKMPIPPRFAPKVKLAGFEEARFAPGMFDTASPNYFTYILALSVNAADATDAAALKDFVEEYYRGLLTGVGKRKQLNPDESQITAEVTASKASKSKNDRFEGKVTIFDTFNDGRKTVLNLEIHASPKVVESKKLITLLISPRPKDADVWAKLREIEKTVELPGSNTPAN